MSVMQRFREMMLQGRINKLMAEAVKEGIDATTKAKVVRELHELRMQIPAYREEWERDLFARDGPYIVPDFEITETHDRPKK